MTKTTKTSLVIATATGAALLTGIWSFYNNPDINGLFTDVEAAKKTLTDGNFTPVQVGGYSAYGCSARSGEWFATHFVAQNMQGKKVQGTVCKTIFGTSRLILE